VVSPKTSKHRLLACAKCRAAVASSAWAGAVVLRCEACGHEETRDLSLDGPSIEQSRAVDYRKSANVPALEAEPRIVDLEVAPPGRNAAMLDDDAFHDLLCRKPEERDDFTALEWERTWFGAWLAFKHACVGRALEARVVLETALEVVHTPAYRALLLARLAQHSASIGAPALAKKWLKARPDVSFEALDSEVRAARAMIAYAKGEYEDVVHLTGDTRAGDGFAGSSAILAVALNIDANARIGRPLVAERIVRDCAKKGLLPATLIAMHAFHVNDGVVVKAARRSRMRSAWIAAAVATVFYVFVFVVYEYPLSRTAAGGAVATLAMGGLQWGTFTWELTGGKAVRAAKKLVVCAAALACLLLPAFWLAHR